MNRTYARKAGGYRQNRVAPLPRIEDAAGWRKMLELAKACADDAERGEVDEAANGRRMDLNHLINRAGTRAFQHGGPATLDMATAFIKVAQAFVHTETRNEVRRGMAHTVADMAAFLDARLHEIAAHQFQNFHQGRPEIIG